LEHGPAERDIIYIVLSGYGVLGSVSEEVEFTNGDVLFIAAGTGCDFLQLSRKFKPGSCSLAESTAPCDQRRSAAEKLFQRNAVSRGWLQVCDVTRW
jgi:uncharacterized protein YjlB